MNKKLIRVISLLTAVLMLFCLCSCGADTAEEEEEIKYKSSVPVTKQEIVDRFNASLLTAINGTPAVSYSLSQNAKDADCENEYIKASFKTISKKITKESFGEETKYGESAKNILPVHDSDVAGALDIANVRTAIITDNKSDDTYTIVITVYSETEPQQDSSRFGKIYRIQSPEEILKNFDIVKDILSVKSYKTSYGIGQIKAVIYKETDNMKYLELSRNVAVETAITGLGKLASIGTDVPLCFTYESTEKYDINWDNPNTDALEK